MMNNKKNYFENETAEKGMGFKFILSLEALMIIIFAGFSLKRIIENPVQLDPTIGIDPLWYSYSIVVLSVIALIGIWFTYMYRKWAVYVVIISVLLMILINPYFSLIKTLIPMFTLFIFVGYGLLSLLWTCVAMLQAGHCA